MSGTPDKLSKSVLSMSCLPDDPFRMFAAWFEEAKAHEHNDPEAMNLATVDTGGMPNVRIVLMKEFNQDGLVFYTNLTSAKGEELLGAGKAAACFNWLSLERQVRIRGNIHQVGDREADAYFASRSRTSQLGAWASNQSSPLDSKKQLLTEVARYGFKFAFGKVPRPVHWSGFRLVVHSMEFLWPGSHRLQHRRQYVRENGTDSWIQTWLQP